MRKLISLLPNSTWLILSLFYIFISLWKITISYQLPRFNYYDDTNFYVLESAAHYRYAKIISERNSLPSIDYDIQYPEGLDIKKELTLFSSQIYGKIFFYFLKNMNISFHVFLLYLNSFFSSLNIFLLFLMSKKIWKNNLIALFSALFYGLSPAFFSRTIGQYNLENFTLPFLFATIWFFFKKNNLIFVLITPLIFIISLLSWHVSSLYFALFSVNIFLLIFIKWDDRVFLIKRLIYVYLVLSMISLFNPLLLEKRFILSPGMILISAVIMASLFSIFLKIKNRYHLAFLAVAFFLIVSMLGQKLNNSYINSYSHVFSFIKNKLIFLNRKPADPSLLPFETRIGWSSSGDSPTFKKIFYMFFPYSLLGFFGVFYSFKSGIFKKKKLNPFYYIGLFFLLEFTALFLIAIRFRIFLAFFICLFVGGFLYFYRYTQNISIKNAIKILIFLAALVQIFFFINMIDILDRVEWNKTGFTTESKLIEWLKSNTKEEDVILTPYIGLGPMILAYANRPIVLHNYFENTYFRKKVELVITGLFENEDFFYKLCRKYKTSYVVFNDLMYSTKDEYSLRYMANKLTQINNNSVISLFYKYPEKLHHFKLVGQVGKYKIYKVLVH